MSKVIVAIPTYNRKEYLGECIQSILAQTYEDFKIIIFDNNSDYDITSFIASFGDTRIKLIKSDVNEGNRGNFKKIFNYTFGAEYLIVFHDDDTMHPTLIEKELDIMKKHKGTVFVATNLKFVSAFGKMMHFADSKESAVLFCSTPADLIRLFLKDFDLSFGSVMYRVTYIEDIDALNDIFYKWCDRPYLINLNKKGMAIVLDEQLVNYRIHTGQDSHQDSEEHLDALLNLYNYYKDNLTTPLSARDKRRYYIWSTNSLLLGGLGFSANVRQYILFLKDVSDKNLFKLRYIRIRGCLYLFIVIKFFLKRYFQKAK